MSRLRRTLIKPEESRIFQRMREKDYSPTKWSKYFDGRDEVKLGNSYFRVYKSGNRGPVLVLLHGGGYSGLTWSLFTKEIHAKIHCRILAIDLRGHGDTKSDNEDDLSIKTLTKDVASVIGQVCSEEDQLVIIGHSMGGAVATHCVPLLPNATALCVIDVVEGTALDSLSSMQSLLRNRPTSFKDIKSAIQWCYRTGQTQNLESAKVSMPGQIINTKTGVLSANEIDVESETTDNSEGVASHGDNARNIPSIDSITEDEEDGKKDSTELMKPPAPNYAWRINLSNTERHWRGWFEGLSTTFLSSSIPKILLMANIHGLDTALTVGQMQGKFQIQVLSQCGHAIHEDMPHKVADVIANFLTRHRLTEAKDEVSPVYPAC